MTEAIARAEATDAILEIEEEFQLFEQDVGGDYYWERIRRPVRQWITEGPRVSGEPRSPSVFSRMHTGARFARNAIFRNPLRANPSDILLQSTGRRKKGPDEAWWDIHLDPVTGELPSAYVMLEEPYQYHHDRPARTEHLSYLDIVDLYGFAARRLGRRVKIPSQQHQVLKTAEAQLEERLGTAPNLLSMAEAKLTADRSKGPLYDRILERVKPRIAITSGHPIYPFLKACKDRNIPIIELQHGKFHEHHLKYHHPANTRPRLFADYLFTYGDFWSDQAALPIPESRVRPIGFPFLTAQVVRYQGVEKRKEILIISRPTTGDRLAPFALEAARVLKDYRIIYKLHPAESAGWEERYPELARSQGIKVVDRSGEDLHYLQARAIAQVGASSTAIYEGLAFGVATFLLDIPEAKLLQPLIDADAATKITTVEELAYALKGDDRTDKIDIDRFFSPEPIKRFSEELEAILSAS